MVKSKQLTPNAITLAMRKGDFYTSTGVTLKEVEYNEAKGRLTVRVDPTPGHKYRIAEPVVDTEVIPDRADDVELVTWPAGGQYFRPVTDDVEEDLDLVSVTPVDTEGPAQERNILVTDPDIEELTRPHNPSDLRGV